MSARVRETGAVFTRNRILIFAGVLVVVIGGTALLLVTRPTAKAPVRSGVLGLSTKNGATAPPSPASSSAPTPIPAPTPSPTVATNASSPATVTSNAPATSNAGQPSGPPACTTVARFATLQVGFTSYLQNATVQATTTILNQGPTCVLTNNTVTANFLASNGTTMHTQTVAVTSNSTWTSNQTLSAVVSWNLQNCATSPCTLQSPGTYTAAVTWPGVKTLNESFNVISLSECQAGDVAVGMTTRTVFSSHQLVTVNGTLTNISNHSCSPDQSTSVIIKDHNGNVVFGEGLDSNSQTWNPGQVLTFPYSWDQTICNGKNCGPAPRGFYTVTLTDPDTGVTTNPLTIQLI